MILIRPLIQVVLASFLVAMALEATDNSAVSAVRARGELVVLTWPHQENIFTRRMVSEFGSEGLQIVGGIDVDVMKRFAEHLGVTLRVVPVKPDFASLIPKLLAGEGDVIASSLTITPGRRRKVDFSAPYYEVHKTVVTRQDTSMKAVGDLAGKVASVVPGTSHEEQLLALFPELEIRPADFVLDCYLAVAEGEADFTVVDSSSAQRILREYSELDKSLRIAFQFPESDHFGYAVAPGSDLKPRLDRFLENLRQSGELQRIVEAHQSRRQAAGDAPGDS